jgi:hypothetical protein
MLHYLTPLGPQLAIELKELSVLIFGPNELSVLFIQLVDPPLPALFPCPILDAPLLTHQFRNNFPFSAAVLIYQFYQGFIFLCQNESTY